MLAIVAAGTKVVRPNAVVAALNGISPRRLRWVGPTAVRLGSLFEAVLGALALGGWEPAVVALAVGYVLFAGFVTVARAHPGIASCGCFGETETPPSWRHVVVDAGLAAGCVGAAAAGSPGIGAVLADQPAAGVPFTLVVLFAAWLVYVVIAGPQLAGLLGGSE